MSGRTGGAPEVTARGLLFGGGIGALKAGAVPGVMAGCAGGWIFGVVAGAAAGTLAGPSLLGMAGRSVGAAGIEGIAGTADEAAIYVSKADAGIWLLGKAGVGPGAGPLA